MFVLIPFAASAAPIPAPGNELFLNELQGWAFFLGGVKDHDSLLLFFFTGPIPLGSALSPEASPSPQGLLWYILLLALSSKNLCWSPNAMISWLGSGIPQPVTPAQSPETDTTEFLTPPSTEGGAETPTSTTDAGNGISPDLTPSSSTMPSYNFYLLALALSCVALKLN